MAFIESPRLPEDVSYGAQMGPIFKTDVAMTDNSDEYRNQVWSAALWEGNLGYRNKSATATKALLSFFRSVAKGRFNGFRVKDHTDFQVLASEGILGTGVGTGTPTYQLYKRYTSGSYTSDRLILKPVANSATVYRNAVAVTFGSGAGNIALATTTGIVTFVRDAESNASSITPGATTQVVLASNPGTLTAGQLLYLSGFAGADAAYVNGLAHTINTVTGSGPFTFTLATDTSGKTITLGSGVGAKYPQVTDALTWAGEFDVPARFDTDKMDVQIVDKNIYSWGDVPLRGVRA